MAKELGNEHFKNKNFDKAIEAYTEAINENPSDHTIYGNRSASFHNLKKYQEALADGEKCIQIKPDWGKGFQRKAMALQGLGKLEDSMEAYEKGIELDPTNAQIRQGMQGLTA
jgi:stress-induced-phosphoprotein 1